jgi:hypothetical protein
MAGRRSFQKYGKSTITLAGETGGYEVKKVDVELTKPSALISDGIVTIPLYAVTTMSLNETYHLPAIGSSGMRAIISTHDDTISLSGVLVGPERYAWKMSLEQLAEASKRGSALARFTGGRFSGLILVTSLTVRTDMQIQSLGFSVSAAKRGAIDVTVSMVHAPLPSALHKLLDVVNVAALGIAGLADWAAED